MQKHVKFIYLYLKQKTKKNYYDCTTDKPGFSNLLLEIRASSQSRWTYSSKNLY